MPANFEPIKIKHNYSPGDGVQHLPSGQYGIVLLNKPETVVVTELEKLGDDWGLLHPTDRCAEWPHEEIYCFCPKNNTLAKRMELI